MAKQLNFTVVRVPAYSPQAVAEHSVGLMLCLNRKFHKAYNRTRDNNFDLNGLLGFNLHGKTVGLIGTGRIGLATARILQGFGCQLLAYDPVPVSPAPAGLRYVSLHELYASADIISLHCPLTPQSRHLINAQSLAQMKSGVMLINTSRGALVDTKAVIQALKSGAIGYLGLDVYEQEPLAESPLFQLSNAVTLPHIGSATHETREAMANRALDNLRSALLGQRPHDLVNPQVWKG